MTQNNVSVMTTYSCTVSTLNQEMLNKFLLQFLQDITGNSSEQLGYTKVLCCKIS